MASITHIEHMFETLSGDEMAVEDLQNATWKVEETYIDVELVQGRPLGMSDKRIGSVTEATVTFTHRVGVHHIDDLTLAAIPPENRPDPPSAH